MEKMSTNESLPVEASLENVSTKKPKGSKSGSGNLKHDHNGKQAISSSKNGHGKKEEDDTYESVDPAKLLNVLMEVKNGNFNVKMPIDKTGINGKICDTLNE